MALKFLTVLNAEADQIPAGTTPTFHADIVDESGAKILELTLLQGKLYDVLTGSVINGRASFDLLPFFAAGHLAWIATPEDMVTLGTAVEKHRLKIRWMWGALSHVGRHEIEHYVVPE